MVVGCADLVSQGGCPSTRGAAPFHDPVRDGTGWSQRAPRTPTPHTAFCGAPIQIHPLMYDQSVCGLRRRFQRIRARAALPLIPAIRQALGRQYPSATPVAGRPPRTCPAARLAAPLPGSTCEVTRLVAGFALRCIQRFALPTVATQVAGRPTPAPPAGRPARSSRTRASPTQSPNRPHRIETELSHDVLNPARVPLSWANSPTLGTDSSPRMRRADIEVPNPAVDLNSWAGSACYPRGSFYPVRYGTSTRNRRITRPAFRPCAACLPCSQAPLCPCTPWVVTIHPEGTIGRLRYALGGDRPSQTPHQPGFRGG